MPAENTKNIRAQRSDEQGFILIVTMLVLVVLTVLCIGAMDNSSFEMMIAGNDRQSRVAFNLADSGAYASGKLISETIVRTDDPDYIANGLTFINIPQPSCTNGAASPNPADAFHSRVLGLTAPRNTALNGPYDFWLQVPNGQGDVYGRIASRSAQTIAGGGAEFASGAAGVGTGSAGGVAVTFDIDIDSCAPRNSRSEVEVRYRKVLGAAGGL